MIVWVKLKVSFCIGMGGRKGEKAEVVDNEDRLRSNKVSRASSASVKFGFAGY